MTDTLDPSVVGPALIHAAALSALNAAGCQKYHDLFVLGIEPSLGFDAETATVFVVNERGERRHGVTAEMLAQQLAADFNARSPGFFRK